MPKLPDGKATGRKRADGDMSTGGQFKGIEAFSELPATPMRKGPNVSHPGPGNGSGSAPLGPKLTP